MSFSPKEPMALQILIWNIEISNFVKRKFCLLCFLHLKVIACPLQTGLNHILESIIFFRVKADEKFLWLVPSEKKVLF